MQILIHTDNHVKPTDRLTEQVEAELQGALSRFADQITRVEVHLNDTNSHKGGSNDKRCQMEARIGGLNPISVTQHAATMEEAISAATETLHRTIDRTLGKLSDHKGRTSFGGDQVI